MEIAINSLNGPGCLASVDCGDGKTAIISPLFFKLENNVVFNILPPGIVDQQTLNLSLYSESSEALSVRRIELTRENVWNKLGEMNLLLQEAKRSRIPIVATVADMSSIILAYFSALMAKNSSAEQSKIPALRSIIKTMKSSCSILLDEVDTAAKEQIHWALGKTYGLNSEKKQLLTTLFESLIDILTPSFLKDKISEELYRDKILSSIVRKLSYNGVLPMVHGLSREQVHLYLLIDRDVKNVALDDALKNVNTRSAAFKRIQWLRGMLQVVLPIV